MTASVIGPTERRDMEQALIERHGDAHAERIQQGLDQLIERWRTDDGDGPALHAFVEQHFVSDEAVLFETARHLEYALEMVDGHTLEIQRELSRYQILDEGPMVPVDGLLAAYSPGAHVTEDLFATRIAFVALLNFPITTLEQRLNEGPAWPRLQWAAARLVERVEYRYPAEVLQRIEQVSAAADRYIDNYNICVDRLVGPDGSFGFGAGKKLISHWGLRDEIRAQYGQPDGAVRQRALTRVMERIICQQVPQQIIDSAALQWDPQANRVRDRAEQPWRSADREPDSRYQLMLDVFQAHRRADPYFPSLPTHIERSFAQGREIPEARVRAMLEGVVNGATAQRVGTLIAARLKRPLEPFDLWYPGFRPQPAVDEAKLDRIVQERYPTARHFEQDIGRILGQLGFSEATARFVADHIVVDPARGAGHAAGAQLRDGKAHLRTRIGPKGMDYKGFNIAIHELGHNVEQVFSMSRIDHSLLAGVPNTGFTEAFAFLFQAHDLELLGEAPPADDCTDAFRALDRFWCCYEIAGVALLDLAIWHWLYEHPEARASELRDAVIGLARQLWNRCYAPVLGHEDALLPAIYSHIIAYGLYTPDYPLGFIITSQVEAHVKTRHLADEMERMCRLGRLAPDVWMQQAVGQDVSADALLQAADGGLEQLGAA